MYRHLNPVPYHPRSRDHLVILDSQFLFLFFKLFVYWMYCGLLKIHNMNTLIHPSETYCCKVSYGITPIKDWSNINTTRRRVQQARPSLQIMGEHHSCLSVFQEIPCLPRKRNHWCFSRGKPSSCCSSKNVWGKEWEGGQKKHIESVRYNVLQAPNSHNLSLDSSLLIHICNLHQQKSWNICSKFFYTFGY